MEYVPGYQYLPGDQRLVEQIVYELKSHGIFDQFRKDCLADVDTKPAYQNLRQRVESAVSLFLDSQKWKPEMNKNLLREKLRKNMQESGFLETGVERIVDQVVNPKISTVFLPQVEEMVYKYLGIEKPKNANGKLNGTEKLEVCTDLLPTDLEAISPDSVTSSKNVQNISIDEEFSPKLCENEDAMKDAANDEHESPPFEPIADKSDFLNENSNDSHLSGISGLTSRGSLSPKPKDEDLENINQDSILSRVSSSSQASIPAPIVNASNSTEDSSTKYNEQSADETMKTDENEADKQDLSENNIDLKMDVDSSMSCDSDAKALVIITESSNDAVEEKPAVQENIASNEEIKTEHNTNTNETQSVDKDSANSDLSKSSISKSDKTSSKSDKHSNSRKRSSNSHSSHSDKHHSSSSSHRSKHKHHDKEKERSVERKDKTDHDKDKDKSKKYKKSRDSRDERDDKEREKSRKNEHSKDRKDKHESSHSKHGSSSDKHHNGKSKSPRESSKSKSSSSHSKSSKKHSDEHSSSKHAAEDHKTDKDKARKKSKSQDDHSSAKNQKSDYRRSTDRDSNDGNGAGSKKHSFSSQSVPNSNKQKENTSDTFPSSNSSNEMSDSTQVKAKELALSTTEKSENSKQEFNNTTGITEIRKPKIASNIYEARKLIKVRRKIERRNQKQKAKQLKSQMSQESSDINSDTTPKQASSGCDEEECVKEIEEPTKEENVPKKKRLSDTKENSSSDGSQFYGFTDDLKVFYDVDTSSNSDEMEIAHNLSATSSNEFDESQEQTKQKSKEEIMEIIFGRGVVPSTNSKDGETVQNGGFQVSYCSDYDDDQDNMEVSTVETSPKNNEVTNCVNNNVHKRQKLDDSSKINISKSNGRKSNKRSNTNNVVESKSTSSSNKSDANTEDTNEDLSNKTLSKSRISRSSAYQTQCYTNEDLYKPRPSFGSSRRRKVSAL